MLHFLHIITNRIELCTIVSIMKKVLLLSALTAIIGISLQAQSFSSVTPSGHTLWYFVKNSTRHTIEVTWINDYYGNHYSLSGSLVIPDSVSYNGIMYAVTAIRDSWSNSSPGYGVFSNEPGLTSVILPSTLEYVGSYAFYGCTGLVSVNFNNELQEIHEGAFQNCSSLTSVTIPDTVTAVGAKAFFGCSSLSNLTLNANATIANQEFQDCTNLTNIVIPNGVTSIGNNAFRHCTNLTQIIIPNSVQSIGEYE